MSVVIECLRKRNYPAGTPGFGDLPPSNFKFPPQIDESRILYFRDLGYIRDIKVFAQTKISGWNPRVRRFTPIKFQISASN